MLKANWPTKWFPVAHLWQLIEQSMAMRIVQYLKYFTDLKTLLQYHDSSPEIENPLEQVLMYPPAVNNRYTLHPITLISLSLPS